MCVCGRMWLTSIQGTGGQNADASVQNSKTEKWKPKGTAAHNTELANVSKNVRDDAWS